MRTGLFQVGNGFKNCGKLENRMTGAILFKLIYSFARA